MILNFDVESPTKLAGKIPTELESTNRPVHQPREPEIVSSVERTSSLLPRLDQ